MTFQNLLRKVKYKPVFNIIHKEYYLEGGYTNDEMMQIDCAYSRVFDNLFYKNQKQINNNLQIDFETNKDDEKDPYVNIFLNDLENGERFGLDFVDWSEALSFTVKNSLKMSDTEMVAHILWEITFWGFSEEAVNEQKQITLKSIDQAESGEFEAINLEDLINELR